MATAASNTEDGNMCSFCGDYPVAFACPAPVCARKRLCENCDPIWHGHPDRLSHVRRRVDASEPQVEEPRKHRPAASSLRWSCPHCTFENASRQAWGPNDRLLCTVCSRTSMGSELGVEAVTPQVTNGERHSKPVADEVPCPTCTFANSSKAKKCAMCQSELAVAPSSPAKSKKVAKDRHTSGTKRSGAEAEAAEAQRLLQEEQDRKLAEALQGEVSSAEEGDATTKHKSEVRNRVEEKRAKKDDEAVGQASASHQGRSARRTTAETPVAPPPQNDSAELERVYQTQLSEKEAQMQRAELAAIQEAEKRRQTQAMLKETEQRNLEVQARLVDEERRRRETEKLLEKEARERELLQAMVQEQERAERQRRKIAREARAEEERLRLLQESEDRNRLVREEEERKRWAREEEERKRLAREEEDRMRLAREDEERMRLVREEEERKKRAREEAERKRRAREEEERQRLAREEAERKRWAREEKERQRLAREEKEQLLLAREEERRLLYALKEERKRLAREDEYRRMQAEQDANDRMRWEREEREYNERKAQEEERLRLEKEARLNEQRRTLPGNNWKKSQGHSTDELLRNGVHGPLSGDEDMMQVPLVEQRHNYSPHRGLLNDGRTYQSDASSGQYSVGQQNGATIQGSGRYSGQSQRQQSPYHQQHDDYNGDAWSSDDSDEAVVSATPAANSTRVYGRQTRSGNGAKKASGHSYTCSGCGKTKTRSKLPSTRYECFFCHQVTCISCGRLWDNAHTGLTCNDYENQLGKAVSARPSQPGHPGSARRASGGAGFVNQQPRAQAPPRVCGRCRCTVSMPRDSSSVQCRNCGHVLPAPTRW